MSERRKKIDASNRNVRLVGNPKSAQNRLRGELYKEAFDRIEKGIKEDRYFEVIFLADSIIADRTQSLVQTILHGEQEQYGFVGVGLAIEVLYSESKSKGINLGKKYRALMREIEEWLPNRNVAAHAFVVVNADNIDCGVPERIEALRETAIQGARLARDFTDSTDKIIKELKQD